MVIKMLGEEEKKWIKGLKLKRKIRMKGIRKEYKNVDWKEEGIWIMKKGMGLENEEREV